MSHELRTPLNAIIGFSDIIRTSALGESDPRYREYAHDIYESGQHLLDLVSDVLDLSRLNTGDIEIHKEPVSVAAIFDSCKRMYAHRADKLGLRLKFSTPDDLPPLHADMLRVRQVLYNLMDNAMKFTSAGGIIEVLARENKDGAIAIEIHDNGIGIAKEHHDLIFEKFGQVRDSIDHSHEGVGVGIGLALCRRFLELHGGTLTLKSALGEGTSITLLFPPAENA